MRNSSLAALVLSFLSLVGITACKKNKNNNVSPNAIVLDVLKVSGNNVTLSWSGIDNRSLTQYLIIRVVDSGNTTSNKQIFVDKTKTTYTDILPLSPYVQYYVVAQLNVGTIKSNTQTASLHTDMVFIKMPTLRDAIYDRGSRKMYVYGRDGDIAIYDVASKTITKQIQMDVKIGYCALGNYNGINELYVPRDDGWLFIYNAGTLELIDQINIDGNASIGCVACNDQKLFISTGGYVACYSRLKKTRLSSTNLYGVARMTLVPGTNSEFFGVSHYTAYYLKFNNDGSFGSQQSQPYSANTLNTAMFEIFPDNSKIITSENGIVIDNNLNYVATLQYSNGQFTSFDFDNSSGALYAGCDSKEIFVYALSDYQLASRINTKGYPKKVFYDNGTVLSVSISEYDTHNFYHTSSWCCVENL